MMVAREFGSTVIGLSDQSEQKLAALIEKHDPHAETVRLLDEACLRLSGSRHEPNLHFVIKARAHLATLKGEKK